MNREEERPAPPPASTTASAGERDSRTSAPDDTPAGEKAGVLMRVLAVLLALVVAFGAAVMIIAATEVNDTPTADEVTSGEEQLPSDGEVFDGSEGKRTAVVALFYASGAVAAIAFLLGLAFAITGRRGRWFIYAVILAIPLAGVALII
jgi:hypothetical protein